jgi:hypothetical protein
VDIQAAASARSVFEDFLLEQLGEIHAQQLACAGQGLLFEFGIGKPVRTGSARHRVVAAWRLGTVEIVSAAMGTLEKKRATGADDIHGIQACHWFLLQHDG